MKNSTSPSTAPLPAAIQPADCGQDPAVPGETPAVPQHPCGSRTYDPDEVFTDPGTLVMIGI